MATRKIFTRDFLLCFLGQFTFSSVSHILIPTLPIYLSRLGSTEVEIGILIGSIGVSSLVIRPFVGRALLIIPEQKIMIAGASLFVLTSIAFFFALPFFPFLTVRVLQGIAIALFYTASVTFIARITPEAHRGQGLSYFYLAFNVAFAITPTVGMFLINHLSFKYLFSCCLGLSLGSVFFTTRLGKKEAEAVKAPSPQDRAFISREALPPAIMAFFVHVIWGAVTAFFPLYALSHGVENPGYFFAVYAIVLILGRGLGGKVLDLYRREKVILPCVSTYIIAMFILAFSKTLPMFILVAVIWGVGNAFLMPLLLTYALDRAGSSRGPATGTFTAISDLGVGMGPMIMGIILRWTNYQIMFLCLTFTGMINLGYFYFFVRKQMKE